MMAADSAPAVAAAQAASKSDAVKSELSRSHSVAADLNANTRSVAEARKSGKNPERLSAMFMPEAFDKAKFEANPQAYLDVVEPARVYQTAEPGMKVVQLQAKDYYVVPMVAGGSVDLVVVGTPKAPVTFTAFDGGVFQNQLNSVTVRSDEKGEARATFMATRGTIENVRVVAGSPLASDQVHFDVKVSLARAKDDAAKDAAK
jgi:hypothetical protein